MINLIITDDHPLMIEGIKTALSMAPEINVIAEVSNSKELLVILMKKQADIILLDIKIPRMDGLETAGFIREQFPHIKIILLSSYNDSAFCKEALKIGCAGYLIEDCGCIEMINAIRLVNNGGVYFNTKNGTLTNMLENLPALSERELDVLRLIAKENCSNKIAESLKISTSSVKTYRERLMTKAGVNSSAGLVYWAMKNKLLE